MAAAGDELFAATLAGSLIASSKASLVLADEPTGELDERNEALVLEAILRLREEQGSTVIVVTHSDQVARIADRVVEMADGRIAA